MKLVINGEPHTLTLDPACVSTVLDHFKLKPDHVSVELNGSWYQKERFNDLAVADGDVLEIVHFVGGG